MRSAKAQQLGMTLGRTESPGVAPQLSQQTRRGDVKGVNWGTKQAGDDKSSAFLTALSGRILPGGILPGGD